MTGIGERAFTGGPLAPIASFVNRYVRKGDSTLVGGVPFARSRGLGALGWCARKGPRTAATLEPPPSPCTPNPWQAIVFAGGASEPEVRATDRTGRWREAQDGPMLPTGIAGPTVRRPS